MTSVQSGLCDVSWVFRRTCAHICRMIEMRYVHPNGGVKAFDEILVQLWLLF